MRLAIIGSREFSDYPLLCHTMERWFEIPNTERFLVDEVISGAARGADSLAARWANEHGIKLTEFVADWEKHGRKAGFLRNEDIIKAADVVLAFWTGISKGTGNSLSIAKRLKKNTIIIYF